MNNRDKNLASTVRGHATAVNVIEHDLKFALSRFKKDMKKFGTIDELYKRKHFVKPSTRRRKELDSAKYFQKLQ